MDNDKMLKIPLSTAEKIALIMYTATRCRICGNEITQDDLNGGRTLWADHSDRGFDGPLMHGRCYDGLMDAVTSVSNIYDRADEWIVKHNGE